MTKALAMRQDQTPTTTDMMAGFAKFLRLPTADEDANPATAIEDNTIAYASLSIRIAL